VPAEYARYAIWVRAQIFGEVEYRSWTVSGTLREPSWTRVLAGKALRDL
jgi:bifunctional non-homologous end joining protein LigD